MVGTIRCFVLFDYIEVTIICAISVWIGVRQAFIQVRRIYKDEKQEKQEKQ